MLRCFCPNKTYHIKYVDISNLVRTMRFWGGICRLICIRSATCQNIGKPNSQVKQLKVQTIF